jgi:hypothetical protein
LCTFITGDIELIGSSETVAETLLARKSEAAAGRTKAAVRREVKSKTSMTTVQPVAETVEDYGGERERAERACVAQQELEKVATTNIEDASESVKAGVDEARRKTR